MCSTHVTKILYPQETPEQTQLRRPQRLSRQKKQCTLLSETDPDISSSLQSMQAFASVAERNQWRKCGCRMTDDVWMSCDGKPCLPRHFFPHYAKSMHGRDHASKGGMVIQMKELWFTKGFTIFAENFVRDVSFAIPTMWQKV